MKVMSPVRGMLSILASAALCLMTVGAVSAQDLVVNAPAGGQATIGTDYAFSVSLDQKPAISVTVEVGLQSAGGGLKQVSPASKLLVFTDSDWSVPQTVVVNAAESGTVTLTPSDAGISSTTLAITATPNIASAATSVTLHFGIEGGLNFDETELTVQEAAPGDAIEVTAYLDGITPTATIITLSLDGTATVGSDYVASPDNLQITIPAGGKVGSTSVDFSVLTDQIDEEDTETITITGSGSLSAANTLTINIEDDDDPPQVTIRSAPNKISEDGGIATIAIELSELSERTIKVPVAVSGTASEWDYDISETVTEDYMTIEIPPNTLEYLVTVTAALDTEKDGPEYLYFEINAFTLENANAGSPATASVSIIDLGGETGSAYGSSSKGCSLSAVGSLASLLPMLGVLLFTGFFRRRK